MSSQRDDDIGELSGSELVGFQLVAGKFDDTRELRACHAYLKKAPPRFPKWVNEKR